MTPRRYDQEKLKLTCTAVEFRVATVREKSLDYFSSSEKRVWIIFPAQRKSGNFSQGNLEEKNIRIKS